MNKDIIGRADIDRLVRTFYARLLEDPGMKSIFDKVILKEELWKHHFEKLTDFWEMTLFRINNYQGRPRDIHLWVDMQNNYSLKQDHFDLWLALWKKL